MPQNLDYLDRILRFTLAVWWLGSPWAPIFAAGWANFIIAAIGWIALVESFVGWCLLRHLLWPEKKNK